MVRNGVVFKNEAASKIQAEEDVKFKVAWWFKNYGGGSIHSVANMILNIKESCSVVRKQKVRPYQFWRTSFCDSLLFNVDGSWKGSSS